MTFPFPVFCPSAVVAAIGTPTSIGSNGLNGSGVNPTFTTSAAIVAGNLVVLGISWTGTNAVTVSSISDGTNSYTKIDNITLAAGAANTELWYKANASAVGSGATVTFTLSGDVGGSNVVCMGAQVSGVIAVSPLDKQAENAAAATTTTTATTATLAQANEIAFGYTHNNASANLTSAAGFTSVVGHNQGGSNQGSLLYQIVAATTAIAFAPTFPGSGLTMAELATFKGN